MNHTKPPDSAYSEPPARHASAPRQGVGFRTWEAPRRWMVPKKFITFFVFGFYQEPGELFYLFMSLYDG